MRVLRDIILLALVVLSPSSLVWAGPPFITDDPQPVEYLHWEVYLATQWAHNKDTGTMGTLPHVEVNYGVVPDVQLHAIVPMVYSASPDSSTQYGLGDIELGVKYRFIQEDENGWRPQVGIFPIAVLPSGDSSRGLGDGYIKLFFPLWLQKSWGPWTTYGGGGYWYHPGDDNKNYWFTGWLLQRTFFSVLTLGAEIFNTSPKAKGESDETAFNVGGYIDLSEEHHILLSAGRDIKGKNTLSAYLAFQWTFGPREIK
ncbi:MAG TPA: hypothetical protein DCP92_04370 [Nitrospiraceae bacterium]|nr:hypothetical protein [Nitrospiraceae bacterium]